LTFSTSETSGIYRLPDRVRTVGRLVPHGTEVPDVVDPTIMADRGFYSRGIIAVKGDAA